VTKVCEQCQKSFEAKSRTAVYCGVSCRVRAHQARKNAGVTAEKPELAPVAALPVKESALVAATRRELEEAGKIDSVAGQLALELAAKACSPADTGSAKAAVSKELRAVMAEALADVAKKADGLDELASRRLQKASGG
jgi:hypothetical protein